jgi:hypothetical protein
VVHTGEEDRAQKESRVGEKRFARRRRGGGAADRDGKPSALAHICACSQEDWQLVTNGNLVYQTVGCLFFSFAKII